MLLRVKSEILPGELMPTDAVKAHDIVLNVNPQHPLRVTDKHEGVYHCYNIQGKIPYRTRNGNVILQPVGVIPDPAPEVRHSGFRQSSGR
jgi:hypothetical protein